MRLKDQLTLPTVNDAIAVRPLSLPVPPGTTERRNLRTERSKTFAHAEKAPDGKEIRTCKAQIGAVCYRDDTGELRSIDTTIRDLDGEIGVDWAPYKFRLHSTGIGFDFFSRDGGWVGITLSGIGGERFDQDTPLTPDITDNTITFRDARPGCDIIFQCLNQRVKTLRILHDANAPRTFDWTVASDKPELIDSTLFGTDAAGNQLEMVASVDGSVITETWTGKAKVRLDPATRILSLSSDVVYPVEIDPTVNSTIAANDQDGRETQNTSYWSNATQLLGFGVYNAYGLYHDGFRWSNLTIPQGSTITSATLTMEASTVQGGGGYGTAKAWASDNAAMFDSTNRPSVVTKTTAAATIAATGSTGVKTYDVTTVIQEIVDRAGWASGNSISLALLGSGSGLHFTQWRSLNNGYASGLDITYTAAAGGTAGNLLLLGCG